MDNAPTKYNLKFIRIPPPPLQKKTTDALVYRTHFLEILNSFPETFFVSLTARKLETEPATHIR